MGKGPIVGVTTRHGNAEWVGENTQHYLDVLQQLGAQSVVLAPDMPATLPDGTRFTPDATGRLPDEILDRLDGLILAGGGDVHPSYFGEELAGANPAAIDRKRDELELALARRALLLDLPTFGICRGCQVINVAGGGGMVQHFDGHRSSKSTPTLHEVRLSDESHVHALIGLDQLPVNTYHHQGLSLETLAPLFQPAGVAVPDEWLVEVIESDAHRWMIGVQWHPERLFELPPAHRLLWDDFLEACR